MKLMQNATWTEKSETFLRHKNLLSHIKMGKEILTFRNIEIKKKKKIDFRPCKLPSKK